MTMVRTRMIRLIARGGTCIAGTLQIRAEQEPCAADRPSYETEIGSREASDVRKDTRQVSAVHTKPTGQCGEELIAGGRRYPSTSARVIRSADGESGKGTISALSFDGAAHDKMMIAPAMVAPLAITGESPAKVAARERGDTLAKT